MPMALGVAVTHPVQWTRIMRLRRGDAVGGFDVRGGRSARSCMAVLGTVAALLCPERPVAVLRVTVTTDRPAGRLSAAQYCRLAGSTTRATVLDGAASGAAR